MAYLAITLIAFLAILLAENYVAKLWGHFPVVAALVVPVALAIAADDFEHHHYLGAAVSFVIAVVSAIMIRDARAIQPKKHRR